ncbi:hypothetical protein KAFR_0A04730 [Kazachstania africana CBS 2517]|uniref:CBS domain-containing protein n=1 Tax=Kazachstania africana (strain ATCC 22294 / BCRC 22015 / CBS 2517 / CECT 1963 / NBRC 1671 / NRRL Y-8276) TaxID=1071382 RepID=H2ANF8_KAZAF|nr:hypothetical protein KAFR_0A04730 [Kazachstania africana CBS 2517]CCF55908.1 hypothetical protein KAFR_0A04730 [Kazachstania africana CBS 2517]
MPYSNDNTLLASVPQTAKKHASIVELLSTPPQLPRVHPSQQQIHYSHNVNTSRRQTTNTVLTDQEDELNLSRSFSNNSNLSSSNTSISSMSLNSDSKLSNINHDQFTSLPFLQKSPSQGLHTVHLQKWQHIQLSNLIESNKLIFINNGLLVEQAFNKLIKHQLTSLPVQFDTDDINNVSSFDYNDLNSYLLLALNKIEIPNFKELENPIKVGELIKLTPKNPFYKLSELENLSNVINILGSGVHRIAITNKEMTQITGILSQRRLVKYLWDNARSFKDLEPLFNSSLKDLNIGSMNNFSKIISIHGDEQLIMALLRMHNEKISSIAIVDSSNTLIGNISVTDVKHLTNTSQYHLLTNTCRHFISIILNKRGLENGGKDSFPIFHVYPSSSLARTIAKLVATKSHRLWVVKPSNESEESIDYDGNKKKTGKLVGVVSLTDILNILARKQTEHKEIDPHFARNHR